MKDLSKRAKEIIEKNRICNHSQHHRRWNATSFWDFAAVSEEGPIRLFKAVPQQAWMNDDGRKNGHFIDIRTEISL
jgi:hypothetical protein